MYTLTVILSRDADQAAFLTRFNEILEEGDCFVSCERTRWRKWKLTYTLQAVTPEYLTFFLLELDSSFVQRIHLSTREIGLGYHVNYEPFTLKMTR